MMAVFVYLHAHQNQGFIIVSFLLLFQSGQSLVIGYNQEIQPVSGTYFRYLRNSQGTV
jgi:lipoate-protein ligase A